MEENKTLVEVTTDKILRYLKEMQLQVGDKLPNEYELSDYLEVGRSTVREAVRALASRNILEVRQGAGTFVSDKRGIANDPLGFSLIEDQDRMIRDLFREGTQEHVQLDIDFHTMIAEASGNVALLHIIPIINESIALFNKNYDIQHLKIETIDIHTEIVQAIERRNALAAFDAMTVHMAINRRELQKIIGEKETN